MLAKKQCKNKNKLNMRKGTRRYHKKTNIDFPDCKTDEMLLENQINISAVPSPSSPAQINIPKQITKNNSKDVLVLRDSTSKA